MSVKKIIALVLIFACLAAPICSQAKILYVNEDEYDKTEQTFTTVDIRKYTNRGFIDEVEGDGKGGWGDGGPYNDLSSFNLFGKQVFRGVPFDIINPDTNNGTSCIVLRGQNDMSCPLSADIDIGGKTAGGIYFLHAVSWNDVSIGKYILQYEDGTEYEVTLEKDVDISNWWGTMESPRLRTAWKGNGWTAGVISLGLFAMENPYPEKPIKTIRLQGNGDKAYIHVVGITLTDKTPSLPKIEVSDEFNPDTSNWYAYEYPKNFEKMNGTAMDASFLLDAPSGKHGFAKLDGDKFVFEDGTVERFYGVNFGSTQNYQTYEESEYQAMVLAQRGVNILRMHMIDGNAENGIFGDGARRTESVIDPDKLDRLFYFIAQLKKRGIYAFFDVSAGMQTYEDDGVKEYTGVGSAGKGPIYFDKQLQEKQKRFIKQLMCTVNPYTGLKLCEDPTIIVANFINEGSIFNYTFTSEYYKDIITGQYNEWLAKKYSSRNALYEAWLGSGDGLLNSENQFDGTVRLMDANEQNQISGKRKMDNSEFLMCVQRDYIDDITQYYKSIGGKQLTSGGTVWGNRPIAFMKADEVSDVIDYHQYYLHPSGMYSIAAGLSISQTPKSWLVDPKSGLLADFAGTRLGGKPYTISEWNSCEPNPYLSDIDIVVGAYSALNGWNPMQFCIESGKHVTKAFRDSTEPLVMSNVFTGGDSPQVFDTLQAGSIAFHSVKESENTYFESRSEESFWDPSKQAWTLGDKTYLIGKAGIADRSYDLTQSGGENLVLAAERDATENNKPYVSLTDELYMDKQKGIFKLNTEKSQAAAGFLENEVIELDDIIIKSPNRYATIALSSLSKTEPIYETERLLLTASARARKTGLVMADDGTKILDGGGAPTLIEPVTGEFTLKTDADVTVYALSSVGERISQVPVTKKNGVCTFSLVGNEKANNFEIVKKGGSKKKNAKVSFEPYADKALFTDVADEDREVIERMYLTDTMRATGADAFTPDGEMTRGDFTEALVNALDIASGIGNNFSDISSSDSCYKNVLAAKTAKIVFGSDDGNFYPNETISVSEANAMIKRGGYDYEITGDKVTRKKAAQAFYHILTHVVK